MTQDNSQQQVVQPEAVPAGTLSPEAQKPPEPSQEEKLATLIEQKVAEAIAKSTEAAKREIQSVKDRSRAEVESALRQARIAEGTLGVTQKRLQEIDPDVAKDMELSTLRAREASRSVLEHEEATRRQQEEAGRAFHSSLIAHLESLGIKPDDERVDWGTDITDGDVTKGLTRFNTSIAKIVKEEKQTIQSSLEKRLKDLESKINKVDVEANSVSTSMSGGVSSGGIPTDISKFRAWVENLPQAEYEKLKPEIDKMRAEGKIK